MATKKMNKTGLVKNPLQKRSSKVDTKNRAIGKPNLTRDELLKLVADSRAEIQALTRVNDSLRKSVEKYKTFTTKTKVEHERLLSIAADLRASVEMANRSIESIKLSRSVERERFQSKIDNLRTVVDAVSRTMANIDLNEKTIVSVNAKRAGAAGALKRHQPMRELKAWTLKLYDPAKWSSANKAAHDMKTKVISHGKTIGAFLTEENAHPFR